MFSIELFKKWQPINFFGSALSRSQGIVTGVNDSLAWVTPQLRRKLLPPGGNDYPLWPGWCAATKCMGSDFPNNKMSEYLNKNIQHFVQSALQGQYTVCVDTHPLWKKQWKLVREGVTSYACESKMIQIFWERGYCTQKQLNGHLSYSTSWYQPRWMPLSCRILQAGLAENYKIVIM